MRESCLIRLRPAPLSDENAETAAVSWLSSGLAARHGTLGEAAADAQGRRIVVVVPGQDVLLTAAVVPSRNRQRIVEALPYILEDQLASDVDELHFAVGARVRDGTVPAAVVAHERMAHWLAQLRSVGIDPDELVPDILALPLNPAGWTVVREDGLSLVRSGRDSGFAVDNENFTLCIESALTSQGATPPQGVLLYDFRSERPDDEVDPFAAAGIAVETRSDRAGTLDLLAQHLAAADTISLLQGRYSRREQLGKILRPWWPAAALFLALLVINGGMRAAEYVYLSGEHERLSATIERIYRDAFPEARRVVDPRQQMADALAALRTGGTISADGFLDLLATAAASLNELPGIELQRLSYRDGHLDLAVTTGDLQGIDNLKQRLSASAHLDVDLQSATARDGKVEARLQLKGKQP
jgi:general secretion pathway protein L